MLDTPLQHFTQDISRAKALVNHAQAVRIEMLRDDILRAAWMMAVGSCDAYFSDAYADLLSRTIRAKELQPAITLPERLNDTKVPVTAIISEARGGWRWRMAARALMEKDNVLSLKKIKELFNLFFRDHHKLLTTETIGDWICHRNAKSRLFGLTATEYRAKSPSAKEAAKKQALKQFQELFKDIFQRRHDCIYNCDRPRIALQQISDIATSKTIENIEFLVTRCHEAFLAEFTTFLTNLGCSGATRNQVCA